MYQQTIHLLFFNNIISMIAVQKNNSLLTDTCVEQPSVNLEQDEWDSLFHDISINTDINEDTAD